MAEALRKSREVALDDDVIARMNEEMEGLARDVGQATASRTIEHPKTRIIEGKQTAKKMASQKRKVKGMMGMAIQHGADVADPV